MASTLNTNDIFGDGSCAAAYNLNNDLIDLNATYNGTAVNAAAYIETGKFGQALDTTVTGASFDTGYDQGNITQYSASCWVKTDAPTGNYTFFLSSAVNNDDDTVRFLLGLNTANRVTAVLGDGTANFVTNVDYPADLFDGNFHHFVAVYDNTSIKVYYDNTLLIDATSTVSTGSTVASTYMIGSANILNSFQWSGQIDQVRIFDKALSSAEVAILFIEDIENINSNNLTRLGEYVVPKSFKGNQQVSIDISGISYTITEPADTSVQLPLVVWQHGLTGQISDFTTEINELAALGYLVLSVDAYRHGGDSFSTGETGGEIYNRHVSTSDWDNQMFTTTAITMNNVKIMVDYCYENYNLFPTYSSGGFSMGGDISIALACIDPRLMVVVGNVTSPDWLRPVDGLVKGTRTRITEQRYAQYDPLTNVSKLAGREPYITFEQSENDTLIDISYSQDFKAATDLFYLDTSKVRIINHLGLSHALNPSQWANALNWFETYAQKSLGAVPLVSIEITGPISLAIGNTAQLVATGTYDDDSSSNISNLVNWTVEDNNSSIDSLGILTPISQGNTVINAELNGITTTFVIAISLEAQTINLIRLSLVGTAETNKSTQIIDSIDDLTTNTSGNYTDTALNLSPLFYTDGNDSGITFDINGGATAEWYENTPTNWVASGDNSYSMTDFQLSQGWFVKPFTDPATLFNFRGMTEGKTYRFTTFGVEGQATLGRATRISSLDSVDIYGEYFVSEQIDVSVPNNNGEPAIFDLVVPASGIITFRVSGSPTGPQDGTNGWGMISGINIEEVIELVLDLDTETLDFVYNSDINIEITPEPLDFTYDSSNEPINQVELQNNPIIINY